MVKPAPTIACAHGARLGEAPLDVVAHEIQRRPLSGGVPRRPRPSDVGRRSSPSADRYFFVASLWAVVAAPASGTDSYFTASAMAQSETKLVIWYGVSSSARFAQRFVPVETFPTKSSEVMAPLSFLTLDRHLGLGLVETRLGQRLAVPEVLCVQRLERAEHVFDLVGVEVRNRLSAKRPGPLVALREDE